MRQIAKWTFLCVICTAFGFGATYLVAHSDRVVQTVVAMLPAPSPKIEDDPAVKADLPVLAPSDLAVTTVDLSTEAESTIGTFAAGDTPVGADMAQTVPSTGPLNAVGVIQTVRDRQVVLGASGRVDDVAVEVGDAVKAGDLLVSLDTTYLDWSVEQAEIAFETARIDFEEAGKAVDDADVAVAQANLLLAQENLAQVQAGPTAAELAAAEAAASAAWAKLDELQAGPNQNEMIIAQATLRRAEIAVEAAQREYDKIAWLPEAAATTAADDLQDATINLEAARAAYSETVQAANPSEIQSAVADAQSAQNALDQLRLKPTAAELASAQAAQAEAEAALADVQEGPEQAAVRKAELGVRDAMIALEDARLAQSNAKVVAPIDGTVLSVNVDLGQQASAGDVVATLADTANVKLTVNVEQRDIARVIIGQEVQIAIYALASDTFSGVVEQIAPVADAGTGFVTFPVIIRFTDGPMEKVLPGMTASATFMPIEGETPAGQATAVPTVQATATTSASVESSATIEPTAAATEEATEEATAVATMAPTGEATTEATVEATVAPTQAATEEPTEEAAPEATAAPTEEPTALATATPLPETEATATPSN